MISMENRAKSLRKTHMHTVRFIHSFFLNFHYHMAICIFPIILEIIHGSKLRKMRHLFTIALWSGKWLAESLPETGFQRWREFLCFARSTQVEYWGAFLYCCEIIKITILKNSKSYSIELKSPHNILSCLL